MYDIYSPGLYVLLKPFRALVTVKVPSCCADTLIQYAVPLWIGAGVAPGPGGEQVLRSVLKDLYRDRDDAVSHAGRETLAVLETLNRLDPAHYRPEGGAAYPNSDFGNINNRK